MRVNANAVLRSWTLLAAFGGYIVWFPDPSVMRITEGSGNQTSGYTACTACTACRTCRTCTYTVCVLFVLSVYHFPTVWPVSADACYYEGPHRDSECSGCSWS